jgi:hypothetical protein
LRRPDRIIPHKSSSGLFEHFLLISRCPNRRLDFSLAHLSTRSRLWRHPRKRLVDQSRWEFWGVTSQSRMTREAPVRTEPHPTNVGVFPESFRVTTPMASSLIRLVGRPRNIWGILAIQDDAESPGSDGASPYLRRRRPRDADPPTRRPADTFCPTPDTPTRPHADTFRPAPYADTPIRRPVSPVADTFCSAAVGRHRVNVVPMPGLLAMSIVPE